MRSLATALHPARLKPLACFLIRRLQGRTGPSNAPHVLQRREAFKIAVAALYSSNQSRQFGTSYVRRSWVMSSGAATQVCAIRS